MRRNEAGREVAETRGIGLLTTVYADEAVVGEVRPLVGRVLDLDPAGLESIDVHSLHAVQRPRIRRLRHDFADAQHAALSHVVPGSAAARRADRERDGLRRGLALVRRDRDLARVFAVGEVLDIEGRRCARLVRKCRHGWRVGERVGDVVGCRISPLVVSTHNDSGKRDRRRRSVRRHRRRFDRRRDNRSVAAARRKLTNLNGVNAGLSGISDREFLRSAARREDTNQRATILPPVAVELHGLFATRRRSGLGRIILTETNDLNKIPLSALKIVQRDLSGLFIRPPSVLKQTLVAARFSVRRSRRPKSLRSTRVLPYDAVCIVDEATAGSEHDAVDRVVSSRIGILECPISSDRSARRAHRDSRPAGLDRNNGILATATAALFLDDRILAVGERLVPSHREDDRISAHDLIAGCGRKVDCNRSVRDNGAGIVCNRHCNSVGRYRIKRETCLRGNSECVNRCLYRINRVNRVNRIDAAIAEIADLDCIEGTIATSFGIRYRKVLRRGRSGEQSDDGGAVLIVCFVISMEVSLRRAINRNQHIVGLPVHHKLNQIVFAGSKPRKRKRIRELSAVPSPVPAVLEHGSEVAGCIVCAPGSPAHSWRGRGRNHARSAKGSVAHKGNPAHRSVLRRICIEKVSVRADRAAVRGHRPDGPAHHNWRRLADSEVKSRLSSLVLVGRDRDNALVAAVGEVGDIERRRSAALV